MKEPLRIVVIGLVAKVFDALAELLLVFVAVKDQEDFVIQHVNRLYTEKIVKRFVEP